VLSDLQNKRTSARDARVLELIISSSYARAANTLFQSVAVAGKDPGLLVSRLHRIAGAVLIIVAGAASQSRHLASPAARCVEGFQRGSQLPFDQWSESYGFEMWLCTQVFSVGPGQEAALEMAPAAVRLREEIWCELRGRYQRLEWTLTPRLLWPVID